MSNSIIGPYDRVPAQRPPAPALYKIFVYLIVIFLIGLLLYQGLPAVVAGTRPPVKLVIYGFSTQEDFFNQHIFPRFEQLWETKNGRDLTIEAIFGPSGTIANQIILGAPADIAIFSNTQHVRWLQVRHLLEKESEAKIIGSTPIIIVTRPGNPKEIKDFPDLVQSGLNLIHSEPGRSGAGDWTILAEYGSSYLADGDRDGAKMQLTKIWDNVKILGSSARAALGLFELGAGDALVTYEQDALLALDRGASLEIIVPKRTIMAEHVVVIIDANVTKLEKTAAEDFVSYLLSDEGQKVLAQYYLRSPDFAAGSLPPISDPFTIEDLGGWSTCYQELIEQFWKEEIEPRLELNQNPMLINGAH